MLEKPFHPAEHIKQGGRLSIGAAQQAMTTPAAAPAGAPDSTRGAPDSNAGHRFFLAPLRHTKTLYLIRHGEGYHNLFGEVDRAMYASEKFFDSHLTPKGW